MMHLMSYDPNHKEQKEWTSGFRSQGPYGHEL